MSTALLGGSWLHRELCALVRGVLSVMSTEGRPVCLSSCRAKTYYSIGQSHERGTHWPRSREKERGVTVVLSIEKWALPMNSTHEGCVSAWIPPSNALNSSVASCAPPPGKQGEVRAKAVASLINRTVLDRCSGVAYPSSPIETRTVRCFFFFPKAERLQLHNIT